MHVVQNWRKKQMILFCSSFTLGWQRSCELQESERQKCNDENLSNKIYCQNRIKILSQLNKNSTVSRQKSRAVCDFDSGGGGGAT
jgi:hypothetical protein